MATITKRKIKGKSYFYAVESKRVNGKPRLVMQKYLGPAQKIIDAMDGLKAPLEPKKIRLFSFGGVAAAWSMAKRLHIEEIIDSHLPKRNQGVSTGQYIALAAINRCVCPKSKRAFAEWYQDTALTRLSPVPPKLLSSQRFWDHMAKFNEDTIAAIEQDLTNHLLVQFNLDLKCIAFDGTNFFTYIESFNERSTLAQRGKSKEHRSDLRIIGVALLVTMDSHVPLFHHTYAGNTHDSKNFSTVTEELVKRYKMFSSQCESITLVFDKGNNSEENLQALEDSEYHFVGSLPYTQHKELLDIPREKFNHLTDPRLADVEVYRTSLKVMEVERTVLVTYNENLYVSQLNTISVQLRKCTDKLRELQNSLSRRALGLVTRGKKPSLEGIKNKVRTILKGQHMKKLIKTEIRQQDGKLTLTYRCDRVAFARLTRQVLGKTILFTDNDDWTDEQIILAYRGQSNVEDAFRTMKDTHFISTRPMYHWTDNMIRVHVFYCVIALTISSLLVRELNEMGVKISSARLFELLNKIDEVALIWPTFKKTSKSETQRFPDTIKLSDMNEEQKRIFKALKLASITA